MVSDLFQPGFAHYLWCRYLAGQESLEAVDRRLRFLGGLRWQVPARRKRAIRLFCGLQESARSAGLEGRLTQVSAEVLAREHMLIRPRLDMAPLYISAGRDELVSEFLTIEGEDRLLAAVEAGKGVVLAGAHYGMMGGVVAWLTRRGVPVIILRDSQFRRFEGTPYGRYFFAGATPLFIDRDDSETPQGVLRAVARHLKQGAVVAYTADAGHGNRVTTVGVLGQTLEIRTALPALAARTGAMVVANYGVCENLGVRSILGDFRTLREESGIAEFAGDYGVRLERMVLDYPECVMDYETSWRLAGLF